VRTTEELIEAVLHEARSLDSAGLARLESDLRTAAEYDAPADGCVARAIADICQAVGDGSPAAISWAVDVPLIGYRTACLILTEDQRNQLATHLRATHHQAVNVIAAYADLMTEFRPADMAVSDDVRQAYLRGHELLLAIGATAHNPE
jgi:hypothetical protein